MLLLVALLAFVQGAKADDDIDDDIFEYEDDAKTIIVDLVMGQNPTTITIPASVEEVKEGAFAYEPGAGKKTKSRVACCTKYL